MVIPDNAMTHSGKFHADDVFSAAFLKLLNPKITIERVSFVPKDFTGLVFDIGLGKYDHHQKKNERRHNGVPYASFGKLWRDFAPLFYPSHIVKKIDEQVVQPIDLADNGGGTNLLSIFISKLNPNWNEEEGYESNGDFEKAVSIAYSILRFKITSEVADKIDGLKHVSNINKAVNHVFVEPFLEAVMHIKNDNYSREIKEEMFYQINRDVVCDRNGKICSSISNVWDEYGTLITYPNVAFSMKYSFFEPINEVIRKNKKKDLLIELFCELGQVSEKFKAYLNMIIKDWIRQEISNAESKIVSREILCRAIRETDDDEIIVLDKFVPWREMLIDSLAKFVIYPSARGGYNMHTVPLSRGDNTPRLCFPSEWCNSPEKAREDVSEVSFCHKGNFLLTSENLEGCYKAAEYSSNVYVDKYFSADERTLLDFIRDDKGFFNQTFEFEISNRAKSYSEEGLNKMIEQLNHVYFRDKLLKKKLYSCITILKREKDGKNFKRKQSMTLDELLKNE